MIKRGKLEKHLRMSLCDHLKSVGLTDLLIVFKNCILFIQSINIYWTPNMSGHCNFLKYFLKESKGGLIHWVSGSSKNTSIYAWVFLVHFKVISFILEEIKKVTESKEGKGERHLSPTMCQVLGHKLCGCWLQNS